MKNLSTKLALCALVFGISVACSNDANEVSDPQFCKCMQSSDALSSFSSNLLKGDATKADADKMKTLLEAKTKDCKNYQKMSGEEMLKRKASCK